MSGGRPLKIVLPNRDDMCGIQRHGPSSSERFNFFLYSISIQFNEDANNDLIEKNQWSRCPKCKVVVERTEVE